MNEHDRDRYFALMIRHCAALHRDDAPAQEAIEAELDVLWKAHGNKAEAEWKQACLWIAGCVAKWPPASIDPSNADGSQDQARPPGIPRSDPAHL